MTPHIRIRPAVPADLERIVHIENASFGPEAYDRELFKDYLERCGKLFLVFQRDRRVLAYAITCIRGNALKPGAELVSLAVDPVARRTGAASALLENTLRRLRRRGATRLHLVMRVTNTPAQALYQKFGFRRLRVIRGYYEDGGDGIAMTRPVALPRRSRST